MPAARADRELIPFQPWHLSAIEPQDGQESSVKSIADWIERGEYTGIAFTLVKDGRLVFIAGIMEPEPGRGIGWTIISRYANCYDMIRMKREFDKRLDGFNTVEAQCPDFFTRGHRLMKLMGFTRQRVTEFFGESVALYERQVHAV